MDKDYFIELTTNLYRLTVLFPKKEPSRYQIRRLANDILANLIAILNGDQNFKTLAADAEQKLKVLDGFFSVVGSQNWVSPGDILEIQEEYSKIGEELSHFSFTRQNSPEQKEINKMKKLEIVPATIFKKERLVNERQQRILEILKDKDKVQVHHLQGVFPKISKRTLRRDFESLLKQGLVERIGEKNNTFYQLIPGTKDGTAMS